MTFTTASTRSACLAIVLICSGSAFADIPEPDRPRVVTTNQILQDMVTHIGGDQVIATCLLPPGIDLHAFDPTPATVRTLVEADLLVINGYGLEAALDPILEHADYDGPVAVAASASRLLEVDPGPEPNTPDRHDHDHGAIDPHAWHDLRNAVTYAEVIRDALIAINPGARDTYTRLTDLYIRELRTLDTWARRLLFSLPEGRRSLFVSHQGLEYFGRAYGLNIVTLVGLSPYQEPDARQIGLIIEKLKAHEVAAIFVEVGANPGLINQIARESGIPISGALYTGTLGVGHELSATFGGMFRLNVIRIVRALQPVAQPSPGPPVP